jgi:hypothetical protein
MSEQRLLFDVVPPTLATRLWRSIPPRARARVLVILAEMVRAGLKQRMEDAREVRDED